MALRRVSYLRRLKKNGSGHLWSIDRPPFEQEVQKEIAIAVSDQFDIDGPTSKARAGDAFLSCFASSRSTIYLHDSLIANTTCDLRLRWIGLGHLFEQAMRSLSMISTRIEALDFDGDFSGHESIICEAEPLRTDQRRFNGKGLFGVIWKQSTMQNKH